MQPWTAERVAALAPDAASAAAGQALASAKKWTGVGKSARAVWGLCQGSGKSPYQSRIDLSGPAFKCSCPSRKFPCKHGLGLLLLYAKDAAAFKAADEPGWVADWIAGRTERAEKKVEREQAAADKPVDAEAQAKRAAQREARVGDGIAGCRVWLEDVVRRGLAASQAESASAFERVAARMVDAQAPGLAGFVRQIAGSVSSGPGWDVRTLDLLGRLHLLLCAGERLAELPPDLAGDVRTALGWTQAKEDALAAGPLKDRWATVGQIVEEEDRLRVRRTWLVGRATGRRALLLDFAAGLQPLPVSATPGAEFEGELGFYPARQPLRALVVNRGEPTAIAPDLGAAADATVEAGLTRYAAALAANPWLQRWPLVLAGVRLAREGEQWRLADGQGRAVPLRPSFSAGGAVVAVARRERRRAGDGAGGVGRRARAAAGRDGRGRVLRPRAEVGGMSTVSPVNRLRELAASAVIGTDRTGGGADGAAKLLSAAGAIGLRARAGWKPGLSEGHLPPCPTDTRPVVNEKAHATLLRLLAEPDAGLIEEWAGLAREAGVSVPQATLPLLVDWWGRQPSRSEVVHAVFGKRGEWLASLNPAWRRPMAGDDVPANADDIWQTGTPAERVALLVTVRRVDPERGRRMVEAMWKNEGADERRRFIEAMNAGRGAEDEPFVEAALDDRSKLVQRQAADFLGALPGSRFRARMNERARAIIAYTPKRGIVKGVGRITLTPPAAFDKAWGRDGIEEGPPSGMGKRTWWMRQILSRADLGVWTEISGLEPAEVVAALAADDYAPDALAALAEAVATGGSPEWSVAILRGVLGRRKPDISSLESMWRGMPEAQAESLVIEAAGRTYFGPADKRALLVSTGRRWSRAFSREALELLGTSTNGKRPKEWQYLDSIDAASRLVHPDFATEFEAVVTATTPESQSSPLKKVLDRVHLRAEMHKEFAP